MVIWRQSTVFKQRKIDLKNIKLRKSIRKNINCLWIRGSGKVQEKNHPDNGYMRWVKIESTKVDQLPDNH